jgi:small subunit ribosomal protein S20
MANNLSVMKRITVAERNRCRNKVYKSTIKTLTKKYIQQAGQQSCAETKSSLRNMLGVIYSKVDKAVKRGILHRNNAARKKSFLAKLIA